MRALHAVPRSLMALAFRQDDLLSAAQCEEVGLGAGRRGRLIATGTWSRVTSGVVDTAPGRDRRRDADHRRRRAAWTGLLAYGPDAIAVGSCALALFGVSGLPADIAPEVALPGGSRRRSRDGIRVRHYAGIETVGFGSRSLAALEPALVQALPDLPRRNGVAVLDDVLRRGMLTARGLGRVRSSLRGRRGTARVREWFDLIDVRAESPLETFARLECVDAGVPPDELQVEIRSSRGALLGRGDLGWRLPDGRWLLAEIDGREFHETAEAVLRDRRRQNALVLSGQVDLLRFTSNDVSTPGAVPSAIRAALAR